MNFLRKTALGLLFLVSAAPGAAPDYCLPGDPAAFNPQLASDESTRVASRPIYDRLVELHAAKRTQASILTPEAGLAESWHVARDGRVYTFQLRKGVHFQQTAYFTPTRTFTSDDVVFSFDRQRLSAHPFHAVGGGGYPDFSNSGLPKNLAEIERVNDYTIRFHLNQADPDFLSKLAQDGAAILSAEYGERLLSKGTAWEIDRLPVGTGPYQMQKYEKGKSVAYVLNPTYFRHHIGAKVVKFPIVSSNSTRAEKIRNGQCSATSEF